MALLPIQLPPGVWRNGTQYQAGGRWYDSNLVRWVQGVLQPIGGWAARTSAGSPFTGKARGLLTWRDNSGGREIVVATSSKLYAVGETAVITDITPTSGFTAGVDSATANTGYGAYLYGYGTYGTARPDSGSITPATTWSLDTWGETLVACSTADGKILQWDGDIGNDAVAVTNAPTGCKALVVTADRILMALGASSNPRLIKWSDQEDITDWTAGELNRAGEWYLQTQGSIKCGRRVRGGTLILTDIDAHLAVYINYPLVYGFDVVGTGCGIIGPSAIATFNGNAIWMGRYGFHFFDGSISKLPCDVQDYVFNDINLAQKEKVYAFNNSVNSEVWWLYPSEESSECDRYVAYNWLEQTWMIGAMDRTCGVDRGAYAYPMMVGTDNVLYDHEFGLDYESATPYAESGPFQLGNGDQVLHARKLLPDEKTSGDCTVVFKTRYYPNGDETTSSTYTMSDRTDVRFNGRQASIKVSGSRSVSWRWGTPRLDVVQGEGR